MKSAWKADVVKDCIDVSFQGIGTNLDSIKLEKEIVEPDDDSLAAETIQARKCVWSLVVFIFRLLAATL